LVGAAAGAGSDYGFSVINNQVVDAFIAKTRITDGTNGTPRIGETTRENSSGKNFIIKY
jgi:hypothetical protein